jgi:micrococcal nuclease
LDFQCHRCLGLPTDPPHFDADRSSQTSLPIANVRPECDPTTFETFKMSFIRENRWNSAMNSLRPVVALALVLAASPALYAKNGDEQAYEGKVVVVSDGNTLTVLDDETNVQHKIRLAGIDAPENQQPFGTKAREALAAKVSDKRVGVHVISGGLYRREVAYVFVLSDAPVGMPVNMDLVREGLAWCDPQCDKRGVSAKAKSALAKTEKDAREHKRGLWAEPNPVPPWEWRKAKLEHRELR